MRYCSKLELALALVAVLGSASLSATTGAQGFGSDRAQGRRVQASRWGGSSCTRASHSKAGTTPTSSFKTSTKKTRSSCGSRAISTSPLRGRNGRRQGETNKADPQKIQFRGGLGAHYYHYFFGRIPDNVGADAHVDFSYNPSRVFSLQVRDVFTRSVRPFSDPNTVQGTTISYGLQHQHGCARPRGPQQESECSKVAWATRTIIEFFDASIYGFGNNMTHRVPASLSWLFFPTSALVYQFEYAGQRFQNPDEILTSSTLLSDNNRVSNWIGYNGAITERFSLAAMIGYAAGFYQIGENFDGVIARIDTRWRPRPTIGLNAGFDRDYRLSFIGNFTLMNRLYANVRFTLAGALRLGLTTWVSFDKSGLALRPDGTLLGNQPFREDIRLYAGIFGEYRFKAWLALFGRVGYLADFTDFQYAGTVTDPLLDPAANYQRFEAWLGIRVFY